MNFNRKAGRLTALALAAGSLIAGSGITANAAPLAGATKTTASTLTTLSGSDLMTSTDTSSNTISGVTEVLAKMVSSSEQTASKQANDDTQVAASETADSTADTTAEDQAAAQTSQYANIGVANVTDFAYIRTAADANSDYAGKIYANQVATVDGEEGDWYHVTSGDVTGYISKQYLTVGDAAKVQAAATTTATINTTTLKVRTAADPNASVLTMVAGTTEHTVTDTSTAGWVKIQTDEGEGYVSADYVSLAVNYSYAESKAAEEARIAAEKAAAEKAAAQKAAAQKAAAKKSSSTTKSSSSNSSSSSSTKSVSAPSGSSGSSIVSYAAQFVGNRYVYGGTSLTNGCDCSGFVMSVFAQFGVSLPHSSSAIRSCGTGVSVSDMQPGDVVCYSGHVGIYAGNGQIVNALNSRAGITYTNVNYAPIVAVRRMK
jgi:cell wall-associated NlpC family hydrolase